MIDIIGAGPTGLFTAFELAKSGKDVTVFEEHDSIGKPVQCTGIVTSELSKIVPIKKEFLINRIKKAEIISKKDSMTIPVDDLVIDRSKFDRYLAGKAKDAGAEIKLNTRIDKINKKNITIGADGPNSIVGKLINPKFQFSYYIGKQAVVRGEFEPEVFKVFVGNIAPKFFAWIVPEDGTTARIGLASTNNPAKYFDKFIKTQKIGKIINHQGGLIPIYNPNIKTKKGKLFIVGDAAGQVKATTGGGLVPGLYCARILAESIIDKKDYDKEWRKAVGKELQMHLKIRNIMNKFTEKDYDNIIRILKKEKNIFKQHNRDNVFRLGIGLLLRHPSLLRYLTY